MPGEWGRTGADRPGGGGRMRGAGGGRRRHTLYAWRVGTHWCGHARGWGQGVGGRGLEGQGGCREGRSEGPGGQGGAGRGGERGQREQG